MVAYRRRAKKSTRVVRRKRSTIKTKKGVTRLIKKVVTRMEETKEANYQARQPFGSSSNAFFLSANVIPLTPSATFMTIAPGTGQGDRIGNKVKVKSLIFKGVMWPTNYDSGTNPNPKPLEIRMWFFSNRASLAAPSSYSNFFQNGDSTQGFSGNITDLQKYINNDSYIYRGHRSFKLGAARYDGTGTSAPNQYFSNNDFKYNCKFSINCTKMVGKDYIWSDNVTANLSNKSVFVVWEAVNADGSTSASTDATAIIDWSLQLKYTDP